MSAHHLSIYFFFNVPAPPEIYTLSLHDALPISAGAGVIVGAIGAYKYHFRANALWADANRSEEHTSELQSLAYLVCRLLLEKKKKTLYIQILILTRPSVMTVTFRLPMPGACPLK